MFAAVGQAEAFLATVCAGLAAGVAYELLRILRLSLRAGKLLTGILDVVFWILTAALVACAAAFAGAKGMRMYLFLGAGCGLLLWAIGLRRIMRSVEGVVVSVFSRLKGGKREDGGELPGTKGGDATNV